MNTHRSMIGTKIIANYNEEKPMGNLAKLISDSRIIDVIFRWEDEFNVFTSAPQNPADGIEDSGDTLVLLWRKTPLFMETLPPVKVDVKLREVIRANSKNIQQCPVGFYLAEVEYRGCEVSVEEQRISIKLGILSQHHGK
jgi:hypothetical protein